MLALTACNGEKKVIPKTEILDKEKAAQFIIDCAKAANPMSGEKGEDLVLQCEYTARNLYGAKVYYVFYEYNHYCESDSVAKARKCWADNRKTIMGSN